MIHVKITERHGSNVSVNCKTWNMMPYWDVLDNIKLENVALLDRLNPEELIGDIQTDMNGLGLFSQQIPRDLCGDPKNTAVQMCRGHSPVYTANNPVPPKANSVSLENINTK